MKCLTQRDGQRRGQRWSTVTLFFTILEEITASMFNFVFFFLTPLHTNNVNPFYVPLHLFPYGGSWIEHDLESRGCSFAVAAAIHLSSFSTFLPTQRRQRHKQYYWIHVKMTEYWQTVRKSLSVTADETAMSIQVFWYDMTDEIVFPNAMRETFISFF